jgi:hypothetical protein
MIDDDPSSTSPTYVVFRHALFHRALFLTAMALNEQQAAHTAGEEFAFIERAESGGLMTAAGKLHKEGLQELSGVDQVEHADLLWWIVAKYKQLSGKKRRGSEEEVDSASKVDAEEAEGTTQKRAEMAAKKKELAREWVNDEGEWGYCGTTIVGSDEKDAAVVSTSESGIPVR